MILLFVFVIHSLCASGGSSINPSCYNSAINTSQPTKHCSTAICDCALCTLVNGTDPCPPTDTFCVIYNSSGYNCAPRNETQFLQCEAERERNAEMVKIICITFGALIGLLFAGGIVCALFRVCRNRPRGYRALPTNSVE
jgi:hypothetical protein